ncbi:formylglycine-generating enzyme family protein [Microscilla marina]|uniref:Serine/threonine-protein kinase Pkn1 n=1 Tax=Microscilla marina ATCC 23134 TaxID=313606 RepID=A1ZJA9_MICM2|nr:formylglycine-generating enzyme family protein [Microscilla marina]EAY29645.1 serine/threonine-protein kinase Pkn1 [Microscilla marina ATCC 23134]
MLYDKLFFMLLILLATSCQNKTKVILPQMVFVKGGSFEMGQATPDTNSNIKRIGARPVHEVVLQGFYMGKFEVTNAEYVLFLNDKLARIDEFEYWIDIPLSKCIPDTTKGKLYVEQKYKNHPVVGVTWYGADNYCRWLSAKTGQYYRLPTEAEWEYAARDRGKSHTYAGSNYLDEIAWYRENTRKVNEVGAKQANGLGLHDMTGNVQEWCFDWYDKVFYIHSKRNNPINYAPTGFKCIRGGSWASAAKYCKVVNRLSALPLDGSNRVGFRIVREK